jgi:ribosomal protein S18 acetylase RimI-like enzyme
VPLHAVLQSARRQGTHLIYWQASPTANVPVDLLEEYAGLRAARQVTFECDLLTKGEGASEVPRGYRICDYPCGAAAPVLLDLARAAGAYSRFRFDPHIADCKFVSLYETWIERSTRREIADTVLVACPSGEHTDILGLITLSVASGIGHVGLLAIAEKERRRGIGRVLLQAAHERMQGQGANRSRVETQLANRAACALYANAGYRPTQLQEIYHFWPQSKPEIALAARGDGL